MQTVTKLLSAPYQRLNDPHDRWLVDVLADNGEQETALTVQFPSGATGRHAAKGLTVGTTLT